MSSDGRPVRATILQASHIERAIGDPNFFNVMPEFMPVAKRRETFEASKRGCPSCIKRRARQATSSDFVRIMNSLPESGLLRLKRYFGFERMLVKALDPDTRRPVFKEV